MSPPQQLFFLVSLLFCIMSVVSPSPPVADPLPSAARKTVKILVAVHDIPKQQLGGRNGDTVWEMEMVQPDVVVVVEEPSQTGEDIKKRRRGEESSCMLQDRARGEGLFRGGDALRFAVSVGQPILEDTQSLVQVLLSDNQGGDPANDVTSRPASQEPQILAQTVLVH